MKYERCWLEIDLTAIEKNLAGVRRMVGDDVKIMAVIKADGYGHGAAEIAEHVKAQVDFFGVASIDEAQELREAGVTLPILILGYTSPHDYDRVIRYDIRPAIYTKESAEKLAEQAREAGTNVKIHIALDTGMTRIGFQPTEESAQIVREIADMEGIQIEGLFTHYSCADMTDKSYSRMQMKEYDDFVAMLEKGKVKLPLKHMANSAGIMEFDHHRFDMVRSGIITYGLYPSDEVNTDAIELHPALAWKTRVVHIKTVEENRGVSYGATYVTKGREKIATVSVGYGDGYPRSLSGKGYVLIHGRKAPIIGRVCMDQFMVDVSQIPEVQVEDEVVLVGTSGDERITVEQLGDLSGRFNYEFVCDINKRVPRYYKK